MKCMKCKSEIDNSSHYTEIRAYGLDSNGEHIFNGSSYEHADKCPLILKEEYISASIAGYALSMSQKASLLWSIATYFEKNQDKIHHITGNYEVSPLHSCCPGAHLNFLFLQDKFVNGEISDCTFHDGWKKLSCALGLAEGDLFTILEQFGATSPVDGGVTWETPVHKVFFRMRLVYSAMSYGS